MASVREEKDVTVTSISHHYTIILSNLLFYPTSPVHSKKHIEMLQQVLDMLVICPEKTRIKL
jgi:hypothetical protein